MTDNRTWAYTEAPRRAKVMDAPYAIYRHLEREGDYIVRALAAAPPNAHVWRHVATFQADGSQSFTRN